jgi:xylulokinase
MYKIMLPGDYIALKMTGTFTSTVSGLSEGILWDFKQKQPALELLEAMGLDTAILPEIHDSCGHHGQLNADAAQRLGLRPGTPLTYRAGDQPNNALALNVLQPGEIAASGGTSGVVYAVSDGVRFDPAQRVNTFAHVNYTAENTRTGVLLCINGTGSLYQWLRRNTANSGMTYEQMEQQAAAVGPGADGLLMLPFGNGAERMLGNRDPGAQVHGLQFNRHTQGHLYRAALEGIAFAFAYGIGAMREMGIPVKVMRAGNDGLFQSQTFAQSLANLVGTEIQLLETNGAAGAAKAAGLITGFFPSLEAATAQTHIQHTYTPAPPDPALLEAFESWQQLLQG